MDIERVEQNLEYLGKHISRETFVYDFLLAYGVPQSTIDLLRKGNRNRAKTDHQVVLEKKLLFQETPSKDLRAMFDALSRDSETNLKQPRFIIDTDYKRLLALDTKTHKKLDIDITTIKKHCKYFEPLASGLADNREKNEYFADVQAAEKMAKLYDAILKDNQYTSQQDRHELNVFFSRLLFCFFAEDTGLFRKADLTSSINNYTRPDGSDLDKYLIKLFKVLNTKKDDRENPPEYLKEFPYVNGDLFNYRHYIPRFSTKSRLMIIECGDINWSEINLDIFGSMMQAVVSRDQRGQMGMHYTSLANIMKVIEPLFMSDLKAEFLAGYNNRSKLNQLLVRLTHLRIFDPACGSGNFLVIAYKEICKLEMDIIQRLLEMRPNMPVPLSEISVSQFYGIEIDDFAHEIAILSLWLAKHQMNVKFKKLFGKAKSSLPLKKMRNIICGNATRLDWDEICPKDKGFEVYILGNPPYVGFSMQQKNQKEDMMRLFGGSTKLDYIACWFVKGAKYIENTHAKIAFVSTNSICQGEQVGLLWPTIFSMGIEIFFCYQSFKWSNTAKNNAAVICAVVGLSMWREGGVEKKIFTDDEVKSVNFINAHLTSSQQSTLVTKRKRPLSEVSTMVLGNSAKDGGNLFLKKDEKDAIIKENSSSKKFIKKCLGSDEFINDIQQWCLWIKDADVKKASENLLINKKIGLVAKMRNDSIKSATRECSKKPHKFVEIRHKDTPSIIVPAVSSERRRYIPIGFIGADVIVKNSAFVVYDAQPWLFAFLTSQMHMTWVRALAGRLKTDYRYSAVLCYNTFPIPKLTEKQKSTLERHVRSVLEERENHSEKTLAELYDPDKMPAGLREAHGNLDLAVERFYRSKPFLSEEERLEFLFKLYEEMIAKEKSEGKS
jgi:type II restriction/modification system DNA methylase subunit YeeA